MPKKFHLAAKPAPPRFASPGPHSVIEGAGCLNCANCVKKSCIYEVFRKRSFDRRQLLDTADSLCKSCFRCVQGCYGRILGQSENPQFWLAGDDYWTPEILASSRSQAETGKIPVSGGGYGGPFSGPGFDAMWTDMSEIVRPTRDGIHGREYISTAVELGRVRPRLDLSGAEAPYPRVGLSIPMIFDLCALEESRPAVLLAAAQAAREAQTLLVVAAGQLKEQGREIGPHLVPLLPAGSLEEFQPLIRQARMVELPLTEGVGERAGAVKAINPQAVVSLRIPLAPGVEDEVEELARSGAEVLHFLADLKGREQGAAAPRFIKELIRLIHLRLVKRGRRDGISLVFGGGFALAEHVAKAIICGADAVSIERPLLLALECRLCGRCSREASCPVELDRMDPAWGRQRMVNLIAAWHGQLLEVLGAMGMRDIRRLRGEIGRAIFLEEIERETFGRIFAPAVERKGIGREVDALAS